MIDYYLLTKPGIVFGNLLVVMAGFLLASNGVIAWGLFLATLLGLTGIMASACVFNNYINRHSDRKMKRTKKRALVTGLISASHALLFAAVLGIVGNLILLIYTNILTVVVANIGFFVYVVLYSYWKDHTIYGTAIGSVAGAVPPVVGYCAVSNRFDSGAVILFAMMVLWQMPHFFAIAIRHLDDYAAAKIPVLPLEKGIWVTKIHMTIYIVAFILVASLLTVFGYTGYLYLFSTTTIALAWLWLSIKGFKSHNDLQWSKQMFQLSLILIMAICVTIPFDTI